MAKHLIPNSPYILKLSYEVRTSTSRQRPYWVATGSTAALRDSEAWLAPVTPHTVILRSGLEWVRLESASEGVRGQLVRWLRRTAPSGASLEHHDNASIIAVLRSEALASALAETWDNRTSSTCIDLDDGCEIAGIRLRRRACTPLAAVPRQGVLCVSVFRMPHAYRAARKYASGLLTLLSNVEGRLPATEVRIFVDDSVLGTSPFSASSAPTTPDPDQERDLTVWRDTLRALQARPGVSIIEFSAPVARRPAGEVGHLDMFGTLVRFLGLFTTPSGTPEWAASPADGQVSMVMDADYSDQCFEHMIVDAFAWFRKQPALPAATHEPTAESRRLSAMMSEFGAAAVAETPMLLASSPPPAAAAAGSPASAASAVVSPPLELCTFSFTASDALRHVPVTSMPPLFAGALATRRRFPLDWFARFVHDSSLRGPLAGYAARLRDPINHNMSFTRRNVDRMTSRWVFGVDEFFLSFVVVPRCLVDTQAHRWVFLTCPPIDRVLSKCLELAKQSLDTTGEAAVEIAAAVVQAAERAAGISSTSSASTTVRESISDACEKLPRMASSRVSLFERFAGSVPAAEDSEATRAIHEALRDMCRACVRGVTEGTLIADDPSLLAWILQTLDHLDTGLHASTRAGLVACESFVLGGVSGQAPRRLAQDPAAADLMRAVCKLPYHSPAHSRKRQRDDAPDDVGEPSARRAAAQP